MLTLLPTLLNCSTSACNCFSENAINWSETFGKTWSDVFTLPIVCLHSRMEKIGQESLNLSSNFQAISDSYMMRPPTLFFAFFSVYKCRHTLSHKSTHVCMHKDWMHIYTYKFKCVNMYSYISTPVRVIFRRKLIKIDFFSPIIYLCL